MTQGQRRRSIRSARWAEDFQGETALAALGIPLVAARCLYAAGYRTRRDVADSPDGELLLAQGIGPHRLASIRAAVPYDPTYDPTSVTLRDSGSGIEQPVEGEARRTPDWWGGVKDQR